MSALQILFDIGIATGPVLGYVHQYYMIRKDKSVGSFSIDICGILLFANILRLNFYVFKKYDIALLFQSLIMIIAQIFLVHICTKYGKKSECMSQTDSTGQFQLEHSDKLQDFWRWTSFATYFFFIAAFTFVTFSVTVTFKQLEVQSYGVFVGLTALLSQSILILPQILKNFKSKSTQGLSHVLVILNLSGDIFKLVYFIVKDQPFQFILCGVIQVCLDTFVIVQIFLYRSNVDSSIQKQHKTLIEDKKVSTDDDLKIETQKNFQQIQMKDARQLYSDRQEQPQQFTSDLQTKDTENQLKSPDKKTVEKESDLISQKRQKDDLFEKENIQTQKVNSSDVLTQRERTLFNQTDKNSQLQMRKVASDQKTASLNNKEENFHMNFSLPAKSMDNMQVQC